MDPEHADGDGLGATSLFASWGDDLVPSAHEPATRPSALNFQDFTLQAKASDGPNITALLAANLITGVANRTVTSVATMLACLRVSLVAGGWNPQTMSANFDLLIFDAVFQRIDLLLEALEKHGTVGLMPTTVSLDSTYLSVLRNLQDALRHAAFGKTAHECHAGPVCPVAPVMAH